MSQGIYYPYREQRYKDIRARHFVDWFLLLSIFLTASLKIEMQNYVSYFPLTKIDAFC